MNPFDREDSQHETAAYTAKAPSGRTAKGKGAGKAIPVAAELPPQQAEERQRQMRALIQLGKERGYLTHAEINDHLPDNFAQTAAIETIVSTFNDMGVQVYEQAPDAETLLLNRTPPPRCRTIRRTRKRKSHCRPSTPNSAARPIRCACTCAKWVRPNC